MRPILPLLLAAGLLACVPRPTERSSAPRPSTTRDPATRFGPLEIGADYASYTKVTRFPVLSQTHGQRFVEIHVNQVGLAAYTGDADFPVGTTIVKTSWERDGDRPSTTPGPIFVMHKMEPGYAPAHEDWYYAIHWAKPTPKMARRFGGPVYWRSPSPKVDYCWKCHESYDREVGLPPVEARTWQGPPTP